MAGFRQARGTTAPVPQWCEQDQVRAGVHVGVLSARLGVWTCTNTAVGQRKRSRCPSTRHVHVCPSFSLLYPLLGWGLQADVVGDE